MVRVSYALDGVVLGEETVAYGTLASAFTDSLGFINNIDVNINDEVRQLRHIKGGTDGILVQRNLDLLHTVNGSIETYPLDWKPLEFFLGDYSATTTYTINPSTNVQSLSIKGNYDGTDALQLVGVVLTKATINLRTGEVVTINYDWIAKKESKITAAITGTTPSQDPLTFLNGSITLNSKNYKINTMTLDMDFNAEGRRNIESVSAGDERVITEVIKKNFNVTFNINADLQDASDEYEEYTGGTSPQTARTDFSIVGTFEDANGDTHTMTITGARGTTFKKGYRTDGEVKNFDFNGVAIDVQFTGDV